jgi:predicted DsbA family dithiol-disulfide isomerase
MKVMGRKVGIEFTNDRNVVSTKRAHALMEYLKQRPNNNNNNNNNGNNDSDANQFMEDLYQTYFVEGKDIHQESLLVEMVSKFGVDAEEARRAMGPDHLKEISILDRQNKYKYGVTGVPFFLIYPNHDDDRDSNKSGSSSKPVAFSGAYPVEVIAEQLEEAAGEDGTV